MNKDKISTTALGNLVTNIADKPTKNIGDTLADIWYLVFGRISYKAHERKLKYSAALKQFENELQEELEKLSNSELQEPDLQVIAPALEASKYCILHKEIRELFVNLISSSLSNKYCAYVHPSFSEIIKQMTPLDARNMVIFSKKSFYPICNYRIYYKDNSFDDYYKNIFLSNTEETRLVNQAVSISSLERLGLIEVCFDEKVDAYKYDAFEHTDLYKRLLEDINNKIIPKAKGIKIVKGIVELTPYGELFVKAV